MLLGRKTTSNKQNKAPRPVGVLGLRCSVKTVKEYNCKLLTVPVPYQFHSQCMRIHVCHKTRAEGNELHTHTHTYTHIPDLTPTAFEHEAQQ